MFGSELLEVVIGIVALYVLLSIVCTAAREGIESVQKARAILLIRGINELLSSRCNLDQGSSILTTVNDYSCMENEKDDEKLKSAFYSHPMICGLFPVKYQDHLIKSFGGSIFRLGRNYPSYIPSRNFAIALLDIAARGSVSTDNATVPSTPVLSLQDARDNIDNLTNDKVRRSVLIAIDLSGGDIEKAIKHIEKWYNSSMQRVSGQYKRLSGVYIFILALAFTVTLNLDTIEIAKSLYTQKTVTALIVSKQIDQPSQLSNQQGASQSQSNNDNGQKVSDGINAIISNSILRNNQLVQIPPMWVTLFGWLLTAFAASLGAPFWFDVLANIMKLRAAVAPQENPGSNDLESDNVDLQSQSDQPRIMATLDESDDWVMDMARVTKDANLPTAEGGVA